MAIENRVATILYHTLCNNRIFFRHSFTFFKLSQFIASPAVHAILRPRQYPFAKLLQRGAPFNAKIRTQMEHSRRAGSPEPLRAPPVRHQLLQTHRFPGFGVRQYFKAGAVLIQLHHEFPARAAGHSHAPVPHHAHQPNDPALPVRDQMRFLQYPVRGDMRLHPDIFML